MQAFYDSHVHSCHSPDSQQPFDQICWAALKKGLRGIAITDHADLWFLKEAHTFQEIAGSIADAREAAGRYGDRLRVFCGVELAEFQDDPENGEKILGLTNYDVVLGSVHAVRFEEWDTGYYSKICFDEASAPETKILGFLEAYFKKLLHLAEGEDFDALAHLTCPLRYINGRYHRNISIWPYENLIREILGSLIRRQKSLEVNTSGIRSFYGELLPGREILERYYAMGGRMITLGSDAHTADRLGNAFPETASLLKDIGFQGYYYYDQRKPCWVGWDEMGPS